MDFIVAVVFLRLDCFALLGRGCFGACRGCFRFGLCWSSVLLGSFRLCSGRRRLSFSRCFCNWRLLRLQSFTRCCGGVGKARGKGNTTRQRACRRSARQQAGRTFLAGGGDASKSDPLSEPTRKSFIELSPSLILAVRERATAA